MPATEVLEQPELKTEQELEPKAEVVEPVSEGEEGFVPAEVEEVKPEGTPKTFSEEEVGKRVLAEANSIAAKSLVTYQQQLTAATKEIAQLKAEKLAEKRLAERGVWDDEVRTQFGANVPEVESLIAEKHKVEDEKLKNEDLVAEEKTLWNDVVKEATANLDFKIALEYGMPDSETVRKTLTPLMAAIAEGKSEKEKRTIAKLFILEKTPPAEKEPKGKIHSGRNSGSSAKPILSGRAALAEGLREEREKLGIR